MCGIGGVVRFGNEPIQEVMISTLLVSNEHRGNDASGICIAQPQGHIAVYKKDIPAWQFVCSDEYAEFIKKYLTPKTWAVIVHTRGASVGNPRDNKNNHPMFHGQSAVIHNGGIQNHQMMFESMKLERHAETDSDIIRAVIDKHGFTQKAVNEMNRFVGSMASAALSPKFPNSMLLMRSGAPMCLASTPNYFAFASEKDSLHKAMRPFVQRFGIDFQIQKPDAAFTYMPDDTAWYIGAEGKKWHSKLKVCVGKYTEPWRRTYEGYDSRQKRFDQKVNNCEESYSKKQEGWCTACRKAWMIPDDSNPSQRFCNKSNGGCGKALIAMPYEKAKVN